jgi:uncharacterized membrane protein YcgQ (UPF0703/DUF1980 family)
MKITARILAPLTLLEWGGILTYFYFSGRIAAFLHPMFRPLVLVTGILLLITAVCVAIFHEEECAHDHDHADAHAGEHEHDEDRDQHSHSRDRLSFGGFLAFLILLLPLALAAKISPDSYGANLIKNRGLVEDIRSIPGAANSLARRSKVVESARVPVTSQPGPSQAIGADTTPSPPEYIGVPEETAKQDADSEPALPSDDYEQQMATQSNASSPNEFVNEYLKPDKSGHIKAEVVDLLYAAQEPSTRKDFEGKDVELIGQLVLNKPKAGAKSTAPPGSFKLLRLLMVCCAADAMPVAVKVETKLPTTEIHDLQWLRVTGRVRYRPRGKGSSDSENYGDYPEPVIEADSIKKIAAPQEKYLY